MCGGRAGQRPPWPTSACGMWRSEEPANFPDGRAWSQASDGGITFSILRGFSGSKLAVEPCSRCDILPIFFLSLPDLPTLPATLCHHFISFRPTRRRCPCALSVRSNPTWLVRQNPPYFLRPQICTFTAQSQLSLFPAHVKYPHPHPPSPPTWPVRERGGGGNVPAVVRFEGKRPVEQPECGAWPGIGMAMGWGCQPASPAQAHPGPAPRSRQFPDSGCHRGLRSKARLRLGPAGRG